ncbi:MAG: DUF2179 domain-containing protein [Planctomycetota bacterium]
MVWSALVNGLLIFLLRLTDVSLGTVRIIMVMRGKRPIAALVGFVEVSIWVLAITRVMQHLDTFWSILGYGGGFASGTLLGMWIEDRLAIGFATIRIISQEKGEELARRIREAGYGATQIQAKGRSGPVCLVESVVSRSQIGRIIEIANEVDSQSFLTVEEPRRVVRGYHRVVKIK